MHRRLSLEETIILKHKRPLSLQHGTTGEAKEEGVTSITDV